MMPPKNGNVDRLALDAAALVRSASPYDWPTGFVVVLERLPRGVRGLSCGAGAGLGQSYGARFGQRAVLLDPWQTFANVAKPSADEVATFEKNALHEAAHALTTADTTPEHAAELVATYQPGSADDGGARMARTHPPRWAMAFWVLVNRAAVYRPKTGRGIVHAAARELDVYGFARADLERLAAGVPDDVPLAELLTSGGALDPRLCAAFPNDEQRAGAIAARLGLVKETEGQTHGGHG